MTVDGRTHLLGGTKTKIRYITAPSVDLMTETGMGTQALAGQRFKLIESKEGLSRGALLSIVPDVDRIDYVGVVPLSALSETKLNPTHIITAVAAAVFSEANIKSKLLRSLPRNAAVEGRVEDGFIKLSEGGFIHPRHLRKISENSDRSFIAFATDMTGLPYIWGGTGHVGVDCSGLVQSALAATGVDTPRDADQQELQLGLPVDFTDRMVGDLLFWPGHVGIVVQGDQLLHANAHHMCVAKEPVEQAVVRIGKVRTTKRL